MLLEMILRIELNLPLLAPSDTARSSRARGPADSSNHGNPETGKFYSFAGSEFDNYYNELVVLVVKLLLDEPIIDPSSNIPFPKTYQVKNMSVIWIVRRLLDSAFHSLVAVGIRICLIVIRLNPQNCIFLDSNGIFQSVLTCLVKLSFFGRLDFDSKEEEVPHFKSDNPLENSALELYDELSTALQLFSICYARNNSSVFASFTFLLLSLWLPVSHDHHLQKHVRCMNCESEFACYECISDR